MPTLHIEHAIVDFDMWKAAFDRFAEFRADAGVLRHRIQRPIDDPKYVVIDLDFDSTEKAETFLQFLRENVWPARDNSPALVGTPQTRILEQALDQELGPATASSRGTLPT